MCIYPSVWNVQNDIQDAYSSRALFSNNGDPAPQGAGSPLHEEFKCQNIGSI